jgi:hypothetical protein
MRLSFFQEVLLVAAAGLALVLIVELWFVMPSLAETPAAAQPPPPVAVSIEEPSSFALLPRKSLRAFVERPLFEKSRRGVAGSNDSTEDLVDPAQMTLIGIVLTSNEPIAIVKAGTTADPVHVRVGDALEDWRVVRILQDRVLLRRGDMVEWLFLAGDG